MQPTVRAVAALAVVASFLTIPASGGGPVVCKGCVPVFYAEFNGSKCYRIPSIIETSAGTLLAFAEDRVTDCGDNGKEHAIVLQKQGQRKDVGDLINVAVDETPPQRLSKRDI